MQNEMSDCQLPQRTRNFLELGPEALRSDKLHALSDPLFHFPFYTLTTPMSTLTQAWTPEQTISNMTLDSRSKSLLEEVRVILTGIKAQIWTDMTYFGGKKKKNTLVALNSQSKPSHYTWIVASNIYRFSISMKENVLKSDLSSTSFVDV